MITLTRSLARQVRAVFRKALGITPHGLTYPLTIETGPGGLLIRARSPDAAVEYFERCPLAPGHLLVPFELLADCEGRKPEPVELQAEGDKAVVAQWRDGNVPQIVRYDLPENRVPGAFPETTGRRVDNPPTILAALHAASQTTDRDSIRFATNCIQLRGRDGSIRATDGRQLLVQNGFSLPWDEDLLIPGVDAFGCKDLPLDQPVQVGRSDEWATFVIGPWTIHLRINQDGRFPDVERHIPQDAAITTRLRIAAPDAAFLVDALPKLPCDDEHNEPITLDLNGSVAVRAGGRGQPEPTEAVLSESSYTGEPVCINSNRRYLARALRLGFQELHVVGPKAPMLARDADRSYVWALLDPKSAIKPSPGAIRIVSPVGEQPAIPTTRIKMSKPPMSESTVNQTTTTATNGSVKANGSATTNGRPRKQKRHNPDQRDTASLIEQAEKVRTAARDLLVQTNVMVKALKQHRRQSRAIQSTLESIRQLQGLEM